MIDEDTHSFVIHVLDNFKTLKIINEVDDAEVFITHLALADARRKNQDFSVGQMDDTIMTQLSSHERYQDSLALWQKLTDQFQRHDFTQNENDYIYLHLVNLLSQG